MQNLSIISIPLLLYLKTKPRKFLCLNFPFILFLIADPANEEGEQDIGTSSQQSPVAADNESQLCITSHDTQTEMTSEEIRNLQQQFNTFTAGKVALENNLHRLTINKDHFRGDDGKVTFYNGLVGFSD